MGVGECEGYGEMIGLEYVVVSAMRERFEVVSKG